MLIRLKHEPAPGKGERAKLRLLEAAVVVFGDKGPEGASVREIARAAGQNVAAIAYYFGNKENLYRAILEGIARGFREELGDVVREMRALRERGEKSPEPALRLLQKFLSAVYLRVLSRTEAVGVARLIIREQMKPTANFELLYDQLIRDLHESLCSLTGMVLRRHAKDPETILRTHMIMGQVYFFAMARETVLRRMGWKDLEGKNAVLVAALIEEHVETLLSVLISGSKKRLT